MKYVNLACGDVFVDSPDWLNFDFTQSTPAVRKANLLDQLPIESNSSSVVYSSHFLEHVPFSKIPDLLREFLRVLKPGGTVRLVLPDLENMAREYLMMRKKGMHEKADFVVLEIIDQCVRTEPGGQLGKLYNQLKWNDEKHTNPLIGYIRERTGEDIFSRNRLPTERMNIQRTLARGFRAIRSRIERYRVLISLLLLPSAFRTQNVSMTAVGERHQWIWDFHQLHSALQSAGFVGITRQSADTSTIDNFPFKPLDIDAEGAPRKGIESMYVEARKPI